MSIISGFLPNNFRNLSIEEKKEAIIMLTNEICDKLKVKHIPVEFLDLVDNEGNLIGGKFIYDPLCIVINDRFIDESKHIDYFDGNGLPYEASISYFLITAIAHECYHYYQFYLENKLISGEQLDEKTIPYAYLYFICMNDALFTSFNRKMNIYTPMDILDKDIYLYSPAELSADAFAYEIAGILGKYDEINLKKYVDVYMLRNYQLIQRNILHGGNLTKRSIQHSLQTAVDFLTYKNSTSGLKEPYLGIDVLELEKQVRIAARKWIIKEHKEIAIYKKIMKK